MRRVTLRYALLVRESANRVYSHDAPRLLAAELSSIAPAMWADVSGIDVVSIGNVLYVTFSTSEPIGGGDRFVLSNLSTARAVFEIVGDDALRPLDVLSLIHI